MKGLSGEAGGGPAGRDDANNMRFLFFPAQIYSWFQEIMQRSLTSQGYSCGRDILWISGHRQNG